MQFWAKQKHQHLSLPTHSCWTYLWTLNSLTGSTRRERLIQYRPLSVRENLRVLWISTLTTVKLLLVRTATVLLYCQLSWAESLDTGLAQLREEELKQMKWEMSDKFQHLSEVLVKELQTRDQLIHSLNVKNTFISSLLKVQSIRYHPSEEKISTAKVLNLSRLKHAHLHYPSQYLHSVIPFHPPDDGDWQTDMLQQLTRSKAFTYTIIIVDSRASLPAKEAAYVCIGHNQCCHKFRFCPNISFIWAWNCNMQNW